MNIFQSAFTRAKAFVRSASGLLLPSGFAARQADEQRKKDEAKDKGERWQSRAMRSYMRRVARWKRKQAMRIGGPVLTGKRLERTAKSCCPANLLVQPRHRVTLKSGGISAIRMLSDVVIPKSMDIRFTPLDACTCGQHPPVIPPIGGVVRRIGGVPTRRVACDHVPDCGYVHWEKVSDMATPERVAELREAARRDNVVSIDEVFTKALQPVGPA